MRQWVLTFPFRIRFLLAYDPALCGAARRIFLRAVLGFLERRAGVTGPKGRWPRWARTEERSAAEPALLYCLTEGAGDLQPGSDSAP